ncbi:MAG: SCO family protein [Betaproteobacteria bacterium]|nr:MAG: SCO family protein [Betaproteobacteria bacterium]
MRFLTAFARFTLTPMLLFLFSTALPAQATLDEKAALRSSQAAIGRQLGDYAFRDSRGRDVRLAQLRGQPLVVNFVYTGCFQVCPTTTKALALSVAAAERTVGPDKFRVATIGFNLPFDTPQAMKQFAKQQGVTASNWLFLTPDAETLPQLLSDFGFSYEQTSAGYDHLLQASIVDAGGRIYRQLYGESFAAPQFVGPIVELLANAPRPLADVAGLFEQAKLLCTVYDPSSGRYRVNYAVVIELIVGATIFLVGIPVLIFEWRRRRRTQRPAASG